MPENDTTKKKPSNIISERDRYRYIGFEVFPGRIKDLFKSEAEKEKLVEKVVAKRAKGEIIREECQLMEARVGIGDRVILTVASAVILISLFLPWYSAYNEIVEDMSTRPVQETVADSLALSQAVTGDSALSPSDEAEVETAAGAEVAGDEDTSGGSVAIAGGGSSEEILHAGMTSSRARIHREYSRLSGVGAVLALGGVGSYVFASGFILVLTAIVFIAYTLLCIALPVYTLYGLYGTKGDADQRALALKKILRLNWVPLMLFIFALIISFVGAGYGFDPASAYDSVGLGYGIGTFMNTLSWGLFVSLAAFVLIAAKGIEI